MQIYIFCLPKRLIVDKDSALRGENIQFILRAINCQLKMIRYSAIEVKEQKDRYKTWERL